MRRGAWRSPGQVPSGLKGLGHWELWLGYTKCWASSPLPLTTCRSVQTQAFVPPPSPMLHMVPPEQTQLSAGLACRSRPPNLRGCWAEA